MTNGAPTAPAMAGFAWLLNDLQTADADVIRDSWGNAAPEVTVLADGYLRAGDADQIRQPCAEVARRA